MAETKDLAVAVKNEAQLAELLKQVEKGQVGEVINSEYHTLEPGEEQRVIFLNEYSEVIFSKNNPERKLTKCAKVILVPSGQRVIMADKVFISACEQFNTVVALNVVCKGKKTGSAGDYKDLEVSKVIL